MSEKTSFVGVGLFFLIGIALLYFAYTALWQEDVSDRGYTIEAPFDNLLQLRVGDDVRMAGVKIGTVTATQLKDNKAVAQLSIDSQYQIPSDSVASVEMSGLLGNNFVGLSMGQASASPLAPGATIQTKPSVDINKIFEEIGNVAGKIDSTLSGLSDAFGGADGQGDNPITELTQLIQENAPRINKSLENIESITTNLADGKGTIGKLLTEDTAYQDLLRATDTINKTASDADTLVNGLNEVVAQLRSGKGTLGELLYDDTIAQELAQTISNVEEFTTKLNNPDSTLGRLINNDQIYLEAQSTIRKANRTLDSINDAGPISAVGVAINPLF